MTEVTKNEIPMVTLTIDGQEVTVPKGTTVLEAARSLGITIPTFCWHPKLKSVGACRMCYVEIERFPKLAVSCATDVMPDMVVQTASDQVLQGRRAIIEFILANHPLDCPTCDKGGECDLQNLTFAHGIDDSRFDFRKYRFIEEGMDTTFDDLRIGPNMWLNRNRCIMCYRCVRANKEAFGEYDLGVYERGNISQIAPAPGEQVDNPFSGNLHEICPVGALTADDFRYKIRVWKTQTTPSICNFTSSGSNLLFYKSSHKNEIYRTMSRCHDDIDDGWLADVSRYSYQIATSEERLQRPLIMKDGKQIPASWNEALAHIQKRFGEIKGKLGGVCIGGLAAPNLDNASLYSFGKFFRTVLHSNSIDYRTDYPLLPKQADTPYSRLYDQPFRIADIDDSDVIVVLGSDLSREHPNEYLRLRKARNNGQPRIYSFSPYAVKAGDVTDLEFVYKAGTDELALAALGKVALEENLVDQGLASGFAAQVGPGSAAETAQKCGLDLNDLKVVAKALADGKKVTIIVGELIAQSRDREIIASALFNVHRLFGLAGRGQIAALARYANSRGAERLGVAPYLSKSTKDELTAIWGDLPDSEPHNTDAMLALMKKEEIRGLLVLGGNPAMLYPDGTFVREGLKKLEFLVVCDLFETETTALADVVLPLSSWAEYAGDYVNLENRVQSAQAAVRPFGESKPGYEIVNLLAQQFGETLFSSDDAMKDEIKRLLAIEQAATFPDDFLEVKIVDDEHDEEYSLPFLLCDDPHHSGYLTEKAAVLTRFASETYAEISPELAAQHKLDEGDRVRLESPYGKIIIPTRISEHLENDVILVPRNFSGSNVADVLYRKNRIDRVKLSKVDS
jgi:NADH-quinone oxidoreductase subunit G